MVARSISTHPLSVYCVIIDLILADGRPLFRDAVARVIRQDPRLRLVAECHDGRAALAAVREHQPAVALIARELDGGAIVEIVTRERLATRVLLFDDAPGPEIWTLLGSGAAGILSRHVTPDALRDAVQRVAAGGVVLSDDAQAALAGEIRSRDAAQRPLLSPREQQVLHLVADGLSAPQIARRLHLAPSTVRTHHKHLLAKLDAHDRAQLVRHAMRRNLVD